MSKTHMRSLIYALFSLFLVNCNNRPGAEPGTQLSKEEVMAFLKTYDAAWNTRQSNVVDSLYSSQYRYFTSVGGISSRTRNLEILAADYYRLISATRTEIDIAIEGDVAIISSRWEGNGVWQGEPFNDNQRCGLVIQKKGKQLKLLTEHCVDIATEPSF